MTGGEGCDRMHYCVCLSSSDKVRNYASVKLECVERCDDASGRYRFGRCFASMVATVARDAVVACDRRNM